MCDDEGAGFGVEDFVFDLPRLSVDVDFNYIGAAERETMLEDRPKVETALQQVTHRLGLSVKRAPVEHAGGKWRLSYTSVLGRSAVLEVDLNTMHRVPMWDPVLRDSRDLLGSRANQITLLDPHELAAGKLAALLARGASRDLFDARQLLASGGLDSARLRLAFVVYGGMNRVLDRLNGEGEIEATLLTSDRELQERIQSSPGTQWKALNVRQHLDRDG